MNLHNLFQLALLLVALSFFGCQREDIAGNNDALPKQNADDPKDRTILGKKLENPYDLAVMQKAFDNVFKEESAEKLEASHLYIKFMPQDIKELAVLESDTTLILYSYPLDYEIKGSGDGYRDPAVPLDKPTYQYCAVSVDKVLPKNVKYTVLSKLFLPTESKEKLSKMLRTSLPPSEIARVLEREAFRMTNNLEENSGNENNTGTRSIDLDWTPSGNIEFLNDVSNVVIGLEGVTVRARSFVRTVTGITNLNGQFSCDGEFLKGVPVCYQINWEKEDFVIRRGLPLGFGIDAEYTSSSMSSPFNITFDDNKRKQHYFAKIFRGAYRYYYKDILGIRRPPKADEMSITGKLDIRAKFREDGLSAQFGHLVRFIPGLSMIDIFIPDTLENAANVAGYTIHEIAHASHWNMDRLTYNLVSLKGDEQLYLFESWAMGPDVILTRLDYPTYDQTSYYGGEYSGVIEDMIDGVNYQQGTLPPNWGPNSYDQVSGYTLKQIEDALVGAKTWQQWKNNIKSKYPNNPTKNNIDALFDAWGFKTLPWFN